MADLSCHGCYFLRKLSLIRIIRGCGSQTVPQPPFPEARVTRGTEAPVTCYSVVLAVERTWSVSQDAARVSSAHVRELTSGEVGS